MLHFQCPHCKQQLENQSRWVVCQNENEFWCDKCNKNYIVEKDNVIEEDSI